MRKLCSVLLPSRWRPAGAIAAIKSMVDSADNPDSFDVIMRIDFDDVMTIASIPSFEFIHNSVRILIGDRLQGWGSVDHFNTVMANSTDAKWIWPFMDDAIIQGKGWDTQLAQIPDVGFMVATEKFRLGGSHYGNVMDVNCAIVPNRVWERFGFKEIGHPGDSFMYKLLIKDQGWQPRYLTGVTMWHQRTNDKLIEADNRY
jgi:hypothetical protein